MKTALITAAARRIGKAIALGLASDEWRVILHYGTSGDAAETLARTIREQGGEAVTIQADLNDEQQVLNLIPKSAEEGGPITCLINNASIFEEDSVDTGEQKENLIDSYKAVTDIAWNFDYESSIPKMQDLYTRAKNNQWNADDLEWDTLIDPSNPIMNRDNTQYSEMPFFKRLSQTQQETFTAHSTAQMLSQFLHGEQGATFTAAAITLGVPDMKAKYYAATQTMDEARHVEVYDRYIKKIAIHYPMNPWLKQLIDVTLQTENYKKILIRR